MKPLLEEIRNVIHEQLNFEDYDLTSYGSHDLKNYLTYMISHNNRKFMMKIFLNENDFLREQRILPSLYEVNPIKIVKVGKFDRELTWMIYEHIEGWHLDHIMGDLDLDQLRMLFYEIGVHLAKIHTITPFEHFVDKQTNCHLELHQYKEYIISDTEKAIESISFQDIEQLDILSRSIDVTRSLYENIRTLKQGRLTHGDINGHNILINLQVDKSVHIKRMLNFDNCVVFNEYEDIIGLYKNYFLNEPKLIPHFFKGYESQLEVTKEFNQELIFNLFRKGIIDITRRKLDNDSSFLKDVQYLSKLLKNFNLLNKLYDKK